jgi:uncharacterized protein YndB with AHSA1/START domain
LVFSWSHVITHESGEREATPYSQVEVIFTPRGTGTYVRLVHSAISDEDARRGVGGGWAASFASLAGALAGS